MVAIVFRLRNRCVNNLHFTALPMDSRMFMLNDILYIVRIFLLPFPPIYFGQRFIGLLADGIEERLHVSRGILFDCY